MLKFFLPKEDDFFKLFQDITAVLALGTKEFQNLITNLSDQNRSNSVKIIEKHEQQADLIVRQTFQKLHRTFITPFDRDDIHRFIKKLNDVIEAILRTARRLDIYDMKTIPSEIKEMVDHVVKSVAMIQLITQKIHRLENIDSILKDCDEINKHETRAEVLLLKGVSQLFREEQDLKRLLKTKEIYEHTKTILNKCQGVANIIRDIVLEYS